MAEEPSIELDYDLNDTNGPDVNSLDVENLAENLALQFSKEPQLQKNL
jgi:hypothetical protein